jgi:hypothetical protein
MSPISRAPIRWAAAVSTLAVSIHACGDDDPSGPAQTAITVNVASTGSPADPDGYLVSIDAGPPEEVGANGSVTFEDLASGGHTVLLDGVAANCTVEGDNPRTVTVDAGETAETTFNVTCAAEAGSIAVTTTTTGESVDPDGYTISIDDGAPQAIGVNSTATITGLSEGEHSMELGEVASNCSLGGLANPMTVTVVTGETSEVTFTITCTAVAEPTGILFTGNLTGIERHDLYILPLDGSDLIQLTTTPEVSELHPELSPDGTRIVFVRFEESGEQIYVMNADGSNPVQLTDDADGGFQPTWSPDGSRIAFVSGREDDDLEIYVMDADGFNVERLTTAPGLEFVPKWSPDGSTIAFQSQRTGEDEIFLMDADGSNPRNLTDQQADGTEPAWSPDGTRLVFRSTRDNVEGELYLINPDATGLQRLTTRAGEEHRPDWSPDGSRIAFDDGGDLWTINVDGSDLVQLTDSPGTENFPNWVE